eukprot:4648626-Alexandrium_andersonii.AAC.1
MKTSSLQRRQRPWGCAGGRRRQARARGRSGRPIATADAGAWWRLVALGCLLYTSDAADDM